MIESKMTIFDGKIIARWEHHIPAVILDKET